MNITIKGNPITKKNSMRIFDAGSRKYLVPSDAYKRYEDASKWQIRGSQRKRINYPVNVKCVYFMQTERKVDLVNLLEATLDILVRAEVLEDDNARIVVSHDGSLVMEYGSKDPRVEIEITEAD